MPRCIATSGYTNGALLKRRGARTPTSAWIIIPLSGIMAGSGNCLGFGKKSLEKVSEPDFSGVPSVLCARLVPTLGALEAEEPRAEPVLSTSIFWGRAFLSVWGTAAPTGELLCVPGATAVACFSALFSFDRVELVPSALTVVLLATNRRKWLSPSMNPAVNTQARMKAFCQ